MQANLEVVVANLEMVATVIQAYAENVARIASQADDESAHLDLWYMAQLLIDSSTEVRAQASAICATQC